MEDGGDGAVMRSGTLYVVSVHALASRADVGASSPGCCSDLLGRGRCPSCSGEREEGQGHGVVSWK
jgi:hypothetical protein